MCDFGIPFVCIQCGTDQNPCHVKVVGPTLGFGVGVLSAVSMTSPPSSSFRTSNGFMSYKSPRYSQPCHRSKYVGQPRSSSAAALRKWVKRAPVDINGQVSNAIPF
ncbi:hypothetical protein EAE99_001538 [Botrytis elliptica]|nr:hypothetical protein EAE99_001538 [Botrytis elliptica]